MFQLLSNFPYLPALQLRTGRLKPVLWDDAPYAMGPLYIPKPWRLNARGLRVQLCHSSPRHSFPMDSELGLAVATYVHGAAKVERLCLSHALTNGTLPLGSSTTYVMTAYEPHCNTVSCELLSGL